MPAAVHLWLT